MKNLMSVFALAAMAFTLSAAHATYPIEGDWIGHLGDDSLSYDFTFSIGGNLIAVTNVCSNGSKTLTAYASAQAKYDAATLTVLETASDSKSEDGLECKVDFTANDKINYVIQGDELTLTRDGSNQKMVLQRK